MKRILVFLLAVWVLAGSVTAAEPEAAGKAAILMDAATGTILYESNAHEKLAPASVTKVMTMLLIMEAIDGGQLRWDDPVTASEAAAAKGGSQVYLKAGETMTVADMVKSIAVSSANDCACAMAEHIAGSEAAFVEKMNQRAAELGMADTHFVNCTGLDDDPAAREHKTSAHDIAVMSRELLANHPDIKQYTTIWMDTIRDGAFGLSNTNKMVRYYPGCTGLKTGFTSSAGYCLSASAARDGLELIAVVLGADTSPNRFAACKSLLDYGFANYALYTPAMQEGASVPVTLGQSESISVVPETSPQLLVEKSKVNTVTAEVTLEPSVDAPVAQGQKLGMLTVKSEEELLAEIPLVAETAVERLGFPAVMGMVLRMVAMAK